MFDDVLLQCEQALCNARADTDAGCIEIAARKFLNARHIEVYGFAGSGFLGHEIQYRLALMKLPAIAYIAPLIQNSLAPLLEANDVIVAISISGLTRYVIDSVKMAKGSGAFVVSITPAGALLARIFDVNIA